MQGREEEALEILEALNEIPRHDPVIQNELIAIRETVKEMSKGSYRSLFHMSEYREFHRVVLAYVNQMFQQISGINLITYYVSMRCPRISWMNMADPVCLRPRHFTARSVLGLEVCPSCWQPATVPNI